MATLVRLITALCQPRVTLLAASRAIPVRPYLVTSDLARPSLVPAGGTENQHRLSSQSRGSVVY